MKYTKRKKKLKGTREKRKKKDKRDELYKRMMKNKGGGRKETYHWLEEYYQT